MLPAGDEVIREPKFKKREQPREPVRILLVEDDAQFAELLQAQLRRMPAIESRLELVRTLADALARLANDSFGLVLTDLNLPDCSGLQTVEALSGACDQPIIVLMGNTDPALHAGEAWRTRPGRACARSCARRS